MNNKIYMNNRDFYYDCLKGLAIFYVVLQHSLVIYNDKSPLFMILQYFHMPIFFFVSGYFSIKSINKSTIKELLIKKTKRLIIPYIIWTLIATIPKIVFGNQSFLSTYYNALIYGESVWFLASLFISFVLLKIIVIVFNKRNIYALFIFLLIILIPTKITFFTFYRIQELFLFFILGYIYRVYNLNDKINLFNKNKTVIVIDLFLIIFILPILYLFSQENWIVFILVQIIGDFIALHFHLVLMRILPVFFQKNIAIFGYYSLEIYCSHMFFIKYIPIIYLENFTIFLKESVLMVYSTMIIILCILIFKYILNNFKVCRKLLLGKEN